jgi:hypothetical protein
MRADLLSAVWAGSSGGGPEVRHAEMDGGVLGGQLPHCGELLPGCGEAGLDRGHLAEPALLLGFAETLEEVGVDLLQARQLGRVRPELWAANAPLTELTPMFQQFMAAFRAPALICPRDRIG